MQTVVTDYTAKVDTLEPAIPSPYRLLKYMQGLLQNWASQQSNIQDQRLLGIFGSNQQIPQNIKCIIGQAFDADGKYAGTTPAFIVSLTDTTYEARPSFPGGDTTSVMQPNTRLLCSRRQIMQFNITIITQSYDATLLLSQILARFLIRNAMYIAQDCRMLQSLQILKVDAPNLVETKMQSKQVYGAAIHGVTSSYLSWIVDTQGPVFKGVTVRT